MLGNSCFEEFPNAFLTQKLDRAEGKYMHSSHESMDIWAARRICLMKNNALSKAEYLIGFSFFN